MRHTQSFSPGAQKAYECRKSTWTFIPRLIRSVAKVFGFGSEKVFGGSSVACRAEGPEKISAPGESLPYFNELKDDKDTPMNIYKYFSKESAVGGLLAVAIPLVQVVSFGLENLVDSFSLSDLFRNAQLLPIVNTFAILIILGGIGCFWYWQEHHWRIDSGINSEKSTFKIFLLSCFFSCISVVGLIAFTLTSMSFQGESIPRQTIVWVTLLQYFFYFTSLVLGGITVYMGVQEYVRQISRQGEMDLIPNLQESLRASGIVAEPKLKVLKNQEGKGFIRTLEISIDEKKYRLVTSHDGREIQSAEAIS